MGKMKGIKELLEITETPVVIAEKQGDEWVFGATIRPTEGPHAR